MGQQMTPDTAKIKCKNFLATLLRLASDQPESVAKNVRALIQVSFTTKTNNELDIKYKVPPFSESITYVNI